MHRISQIDDIIRRGTYPSASQLAKELGVSLRTINRDLDVIRGYYYAPLEYDQTRRGWYYKDPNFFIKYIQIEEGELFSLALFDTLLLQYKNTPLEKKLSPILEKIRHIMFAALFKAVMRPVFIKLLYRMAYIAGMEKQIVTIF